MKKLEDYDLKKLIRNAKRAGACDDIHLFEKYSTVKEALENVHSLTLYKSLVWYAENVIEGRWLEAEEFIMKCPHTIFDYARNVIKGRWPEAEETIMGDSFYSWLYTEDVINGRWYEDETSLLDRVYRKLIKFVRSFMNI